MPPTTNTLRKKIIVLGIGFLLLISAIFIFNLFNRSTLVITTVEDGEIYISKSQGGKFEHIGKTKATYKTSFEGVVYIKTTKGEGETQSSANIKRRQATEKSIDIKETRQYKHLGMGPLSYIHKEADFLYGINPSTRSLSSKPINGNGSLPPASFVGKPFAKKVTWNDSKNYIFNSYGDGVYITTKNYETIVSTTAEDSQDLIVDYAKHPGKPVVFLAVDGVYIESDLSNPAQPEIRKITEVTPKGSVYFNADKDRIYLAIQEFEYATDKEGDIGQPVSSKLYVLNYKGDKLHEFNLDIADTVYKIQYIKSLNNYAVLTNSALWLLDPVSGSTFASPYYFRNTKDLLVVNGELITLNDGGLWSYDPKENTFHKIASFNDGEKYVENSLTILGDSIVFSSNLTRETVIEESDNSSNSRIYSMPID